MKIWLTSFIASKCKLKITLKYHFSSTRFVKIHVQYMLTVSHICSHACSWKGKLPIEGYLAVCITITNNSLTQQFPPLGIYPIYTCPCKTTIRSSLDVYNMGPANNGSSMKISQIQILLIRYQCLVVCVCVGGNSYIHLDGWSPQDFIQCFRFFKR